MTARRLKGILTVLVLLIISPGISADGSASLGGAMMVGLVLVLLKLAAVGFIIYLLYSLIRVKNKYHSKEVTLIVLDDRTLITNITYKSSQDIEKDFDRYISSSGPWDEVDVIDLLNKEYPNLNPSASEQIESLLRRGNNTAILQF